ncbi:MAG: hypothetical protein H7A52_17010 [Akkermansiaceae bacterium]|nr:hypothetical protein [Akkermansiaceae bacterium]
MRRRLALWLIAAALVIGGFIALKLTIPFSYAEAELRAPAIEYVKELQRNGKIAPGECAARYLYFQTDYHTQNPDRIRIAEKEIAENQVRITLHDPSCRDDSIHSSITRIYLETSNEGIWIPVRHEWSHTGRGRFGWTTEPTT